ncbi:MAG: 5-(carboxyamino)imidazole ribonucleotide mutase [Methanothrix sp.]|jgi:5-(carboxyamino)imidazole ribonucleotide mutase|nr:5-(carboxyamino)imidazole ribonucleotide mutase [Methanothrix sp.]OPX80318.1 MAG: N5-carboxyaminoimidazole ribonucleotide mutase [Methanosaeta sp. PtaB.Bin087]OPY51341.1 MAG: N5-carboxyaminoimidazole ribonucleotide mutase [Methanosaeta sp. PtaU1.Bin055]NLX39612.1 AIR carboxylase family protein [Methanothrix sp.]HNR57283.1 5-(carboxyamino)imidazole ribonucleotide mutase [Methanothrix sp.]
MTDIAVISGSKSDSSVVEKVLRVLVEKGVDYDERILSAHRDPVALDRYIKETDAKIFIAVAGLSAALPGFIASRTDRPVIGVPVSAKLGGLDALLAISQMPPGVPVACVGIDAGENAALLAVRILRAKDRP